MTVFSGNLVAVHVHRSRNMTPFLLLRDIFRFSGLHCTDTGSLFRSLGKGRSLIQKAGAGTKTHLWARSPVRVFHPSPLALGHAEISRISRPLALQSSPDLRGSSQLFIIRRVHPVIHSFSFLGCLSCTDPACLSLVYPCPRTLLWICDMEIRENSVIHAELPV